MAKQTITKLIDDIDGSEASESLSFSFDGAEYEIDLNEEHANRLREALRPFTDAGRRTSGGRGRPTTRKASTGNDTKAIRLWAVDNGFQVNSRGRIQADIIEKYHAAH